MKLFYLFRLFSFSILMLCSVQLAAQNKRILTRAQIDSILHPKVLVGADKMFRFKQQSVHIGKLSEDHQPVDVIFSFTNESGKEISIDRITTDCGCTVAQSDKLVYQAGESGTITVKYTPKNHVGTIDASTYVFATLSKSQPIAKLTILGEVLPGEDSWKGYHFSMGPLRLKQVRQAFCFNRPEVQTERILCANSGMDDLVLSAKKLPSYIQFRTEPTVIHPGDEADLIIRVDGTQLTHREKVVEVDLEINGLPQEVNQRVIKIIIDLSKIK